MESEHGSSGRNVRVFVGVLGGTVGVYGIQYVSDPEGGYRVWGAMLLGISAAIEFVVWKWDPIAGGVKSRIGLIGAICVAAVVGLSVQRWRSDQDGLVAAVSVLLFYLVWRVVAYVIRLRRDLDRYVMPRVLTERQAKAIKENVQGSGVITVKVNGRDSEATNYAGQLFSALRNTEWTVDMSTADAPPSTDGEGIFTQLIGQNSAPDQRNPGGELQALVEALSKSGVHPNGGGGQGAGEYKMYLIVGRRPLVVGPPPLRSKLGQWIMRTIIMRPR